MTAAQGDLYQRKGWPPLVNVTGQPLPTPRDRTRFRLAPTGAHEAFCLDGSGYVICPGRAHVANVGGTQAWSPVWVLFYVPKALPARRPFQPRPQYLATGESVEQLAAIADEHNATRAVGVANG